MKREVELKYELAGAEAAERMREAGLPQGLSYGPWREMTMMDAYLDTSGRKLYRAGFALRLREDESGILATVKELNPSRGALHTRGEYEQRMARPADSAIKKGVRDGHDPAGLWPEGEVKDLLQPLIGSEELIELFRFRQRRNVAPLLRGGAPVAEVFFDRIDMRREGDSITLYEMEVELGESPDAVTTVERWIDSLGGIFPGGLRPAGLSKFEQACQFFDISFGP
jgi:inorganic triphosphatase YgiF